MLAICKDTTTVTEIGIIEAFPVPTIDVVKTTTDIWTGITLIAVLPVPTILAINKTTDTASEAALIETLPDPEIEAVIAITGIATETAVIDVLPVDVIDATEIDIDIDIETAVKFWATPTALKRSPPLNVEPPVDLRNLKTVAILSSHCPACAEADPASCNYYCLLQVQVKRFTCGVVSISA